MDIKSKQWSAEETNCLLAVWSSTEIQNKLDGATRTKPVYEQIQREMAAAGFDRSIDQINNKLKKLKKDLRDQNKDLERSGNGRPRKTPHFDITLLDSDLGDRPACKLNGALNSATAILEAKVIDHTLMQDSTDPGRNTMDRLMDSVSLQSLQLHHSQLTTELTGEQLRIAEAQLKSLLPHSMLVYGYLVVRNRVHADPIQVIVDQWPDFNVILCQHEQKGDLFKDICVFAKDEAVLKETLRRTDFIDWTENLCFGIDLHHEEIVRAVASERNLSGSKAVVCRMMTHNDKLILPPIDSSGMSIGSLDAAHASLVNQAWMYSRGEHTVGMVRNLITNLPSCCVLDAEGQPVAWILTFTSCAMGMLHTLPEHRGKGYAKVVVCGLIQKLRAQGYPVYGFVEEENTPSYILQKSIGATEEDPSYRDAWVLFNHF